MRHDLRGDDGMYRCCTPAEERGKRATMLTQTHEGRFTHERDAADRRMSLDIELPYETPRFKGKRVNRDAYHPKVTK